MSPPDLSRAACHGRAVPAPAPLLIRADAGGMLGTGHVMRMIALAQAWQDRGGVAHLACVRCPEGIEQRARAEGIVAHQIAAAEPGDMNDAGQTRHLARHLAAAVLVLDGYHFSEAYQQAVAQQGLRLACVDDYGHCENWHSDWVLNQNFHARCLQQPHAAAPNRPVFLCGPGYAMLRREFRMASITAGIQAARKVLVTFGGVDPGGVTATILLALKDIAIHGLHVRVLLGAGNPWAEKIREIAAQLPFPTEVLSSVSQMPAMYQWADAVISAAGSSCYEWLYFQLPAWVIPIADNQQPIAAALAGGNLAKVAASATLDDLDGLRNSLETWLASHAQRPPRIVDGYGAVRVAARFCAPCCWIRRVFLPDDAGYLFELANQPDIRGAGAHIAPVLWDEHVLWLAQHCASKASALFAIIGADDDACGLVRFHRLEADCWEIGISLFARARGQGIARVALTLAMREMQALHKVASWLATIRQENESSRALFASLGFNPLTATGRFDSWILHAPTGDPAATTPP